LLSTTVAEAGGALYLYFLRSQHAITVNLVSIVGEHSVLQRRVL